MRTRRAAFPAVCLATIVKQGIPQREAVTIMGSIRRSPRNPSMWEVRYRDPGGHQRTKRFDTKADARAFDNAIETDKRRGVWIDPLGIRTPFEDWARQCLASRLHLRSSSRARDESYLQNHVIPEFESARLGSITPLDVQRWITSLTENGLSPNTVRECYRLMSGVMKAASTARLIGDSPCRGISLPRVETKQQRFLSPTEVEQLALALQPTHYRALIYAAAYLGCRWGELVGLKRHHLNLMRNRVHIVGTLEEVNGKLKYVEETKSRAGKRVLEMPAFLNEMLSRYLGEAPPSDFVFTTSTGGCLYRGSFRQRIWLPGVERAGLAPLRFHDLRHTCAALLISSGAEAKDVQEHLGHSSIVTTMNVYGHLLEGRKKEIASRLQHMYEQTRDSDVVQAWCREPENVVKMHPDLH